MRPLIPECRPILRRVALLTLCFLAMVPSGCGPSFNVEPVTFRLTRADQLLGAVHRHTVWINGEKVGMIRNGATNTFHFLPKMDEKNVMYIEAYDPFLENPKTDKLFFDIGSGGEMVGEVKWEQNGSGIDLMLEVSVVKAGKYPPKK